jgi:hypothetical protein
MLTFSDCCAVRASRASAAGGQGYSQGYTPMGHGPVARSWVNETGFHHDGCLVHNRCRVGVASGGTRFSESPPVTFA